MTLIQCTCLELAAEHHETGQSRTVTTEQLCGDDLWRLLTTSERQKYDAHIPHIVEQGRLPLVQVNASGNSNQYRYSPRDCPLDLDEDDTQLNSDFAHFQD